MRRKNKITVNDWIDTHLDYMHGRKLRIINTDTGKGVGDMTMLYMDKKVKAVKITTRFLFIYV